MPRRRFFVRSLFTVLVVVATPHLRAADLLWNLPGTNTWTSANWGGAIPTVVDNLSFINPGVDPSGYYRPNYSILQSGLTAYSQNLSLSSSYNDFVVLTINGTLVSSLNASIHIGQRGAVNVDNGSWYAAESTYTAGSGGGSVLNITNKGYVVFKSAVMGSHASTTVDDGAWSVSDALALNATGARLTIRNGGRVNSASGTITERSEATVQGVGSSWTMTGNLTVATGYGTGTLGISDGARVETGGVTYLGTDQHYSKAYISLSGVAGKRGVLSTNQIIAPGTGYSYGGDRLLTFDGGILQARSSQTNFLPNVESTDIANNGGGIFINSNGYDIGIGISLPGTGGLTKLGTGNLTLSGGGTSAYQGHTTVKNGTLTLQRSHSTPSRNYIIGESSGDDGMLVIDGVAVSHSDTILGAAVGAAGTVKIDSGSLSSSGNLLVGNGGTGTLIMDGGTVSAPTIFFGNNGGTGSGTINAGTLSASGALLVARGSLTIKSGGSVSAPSLLQFGFTGGTGSLDLQTGGSLASGGTVIGIGGTGTATVSGGTWTVSSDLLIGVSSGTGTLTVSGGSVRVNAQVVMNAGGVGALSLSDESGNSGLLSANGILKAGSGQASIAFNGGTLRALASDSDFLEGFASGEVTIGTRGATIDTNGKTIGISTVLGGTGGLTKTGSGTLALSGNNSYGGGTVIEGGTLRLDHDKALGVPDQLAVHSGTLDLNGRDVTVTSLSGTAGIIANGATGGSVLTVDQDTDTTFAGSIRDGSGRTSLTKQGSGRLLLSGNNSYSGGTTIEAGKLVLTGTNTGTGEIRVNGGTLIVNGDNSGVTGAVRVADSGALGGSGTIGGHVTIESGGTISPGSSPGILGTGDQTWDGGGTYIWELNSATGDAGANWDLLTITGSLSLDALDAGDPFTIAIVSLDATNAPGAANHFDPAQSYTWIIATASGGINGFSADHFVIDTNEFGNASGSTGFSITTVGNDLVLIYSAVPEPHEYAIAIAGLLLGIALLRRHGCLARK